MPQGNAIEFKGTKNGIYVLIKQQLNDYESIKDELIARLEKTKSFFTGAKILDIQCDILSTDEKKKLETLMKDRYNMEIVKGPIHDIPKREVVFEGIYEGKTKFIEGTIRSGQIINYEGNVVIVGDVNPGAQITAHGNIVVMGSLRGIAHAGSNGNQEAFVVAYYLDPTQLRIAELIARSPDGNYEKPKGPELARVRDNIVIIEPYLSKK